MKKRKEVGPRLPHEVLYQNARIRVVCITVDGEGKLASERACGVDATGLPIWRNTVNEVSADFVYAIAELRGLKCLPVKGWVRVRNG